MKLGVVIAAGGIGSRMRAGSSKQLLEVAGRPVIARTTAIFEAHPEVAEIVIAIDEKALDSCRILIQQAGFGKVQAVVAGGGSRAESVVNALSELSGDIDTVCIHDGARPLFQGSMLADALRDLGDPGLDGVVFGLPCIDTIKEVDPDSKLIAATPSRDRLWAAQTPQIFRRQILEKAFAVAPEILRMATDDSSLVEMIGGRIKITLGSRENIKLTVPEDLLIAEQFIKVREGSATGEEGKAER